ncbi:MAG TPA: transposase [Candidatus Scybalocola faecigallinarum]|uniref:Transposase n=1 Tax=Candidatus Scybalocola faecigallinarum TaxID=2840941 RepID=A0A9D1JPP5_9FIRM|nr:transposase [Candidatus Scybalocola faecigallinarum]
MFLTFGRNLKWNSHIHCHISEGGYRETAQSFMYILYQVHI